MISMATAKRGMCSAMGLSTSTVTWTIIKAGF